MKVLLSVMTLFFVIAACPAHAETIYLKDGRAVKGKIVNKDSYGVVIQEGMMPRRYYSDQILRIDSDVPEPEPTAAPADTTASALANIAPGKVSLIKTLIEVSGARQNMQANIKRIIAQAPAENQPELKTIFDLDAFIAQLIPLYDKYYSEEDLRQIIAFYQSPAGQKVIEVTPKIMGEAMQASLQYFQQKTAP